ncbi:MAG: hypothetical protein WCH34_15980 [Bacteroidota bacterium]
MKTITRFTAFLVVIFLFLALNNSSAATAIWVNTSGGVWTTAANWQSGNIPAANDDIQFSTAGTYTITGVPSLNVRSLKVSDGVFVTLQASATASLSINGSTSATNLDISSGGSLTLGGGAAYVLTLTFATTALQVANISGIMTLNSYSAFASGIANTTVNVGGTLNLNAATSTSFVTTNMICSVLGIINANAAITTLTTSAATLS